MTKVAILLVDLIDDYAKPGGKMYNSVSNVMTSTSMMDKIPDVVAAARESEHTIVIHSPSVFPSASSADDVEEKKAAITPTEDNKASNKRRNLKKMFKSMKAVKKKKSTSDNKDILSSIIAEVRPSKDDDDIVLTPREDPDEPATENTNLEQILIDNKVQAVIVMGFLADKSITDTCNDLTDIQGLRVVVCSDGVGAFSEKERAAATTVTLPMIGVEVMTCDEAESLIEDAENISMKVLPTNSRNARATLARTSKLEDRRTTFMNEAKGKARKSSLLTVHKDRLTKKNRVSVATINHYYPEVEEVRIYGTLCGIWICISKIYNKNRTTLIIYLYHSPMKMDLIQLHRSS